MTASSKHTKGYNERLFTGGGLRSYLHNSRFNWFRAQQTALGFSTARVIELGCFDGRLLGFMASAPLKYEGLDADWEGGLSKAQTKFADHPDWHFTKSDDPADLQRFAKGSFDLAVALETIEHIPASLVDIYLAELARVLDGVLVISVPNEKGLVFLAKWLAKKLIFGGAEKYRWAELCNAVLGRMSRIERNEHKGFDHAQLARQIAIHFDDVKVQAMPFKSLPVWLGFTVGITAKSRPKPE